MRKQFQVIQPVIPPSYGCATNTCAASAAVALLLGLVYARRHCKASNEYRNWLGSVTTMGPKGNKTTICTICDVRKKDELDLGLRFKGGSGSHMLYVHV